jgi:hypothetical protein
MTISGAHHGGQPAGDAVGPTGSRPAAEPEPVAAPAAGQAASAASAATGAATRAAVATAQVVATPKAVAAASTLPTLPSAPPDSPGDDLDTDQAGASPGRAAYALPRLRIGCHVVSEAALAEFSLALTGSGLLLGPDIDKRPATVSLFRPEPVRVALVGGAWLSQLMLFRALTLGARVAIMTAQPDAWNGFGAWATGQADRVAVLPLDRPVQPPASAAEPGLVVWDAGLLGPPAPLALGPWLTQLTMMTQLGLYGLPAVQGARLVITQRLAAAEAEVVAGALQLDPETTRLLQLLETDMVALLSRGTAARYVWITPTSAEQRHLGTPRR